MKRNLLKKVLVALMSLCLTFNYIQPMKTYLAQASIIGVENGFSIDVNTGIIIGYSSFSKNLVIPEKVSGITVKGVAAYGVISKGVVSLELPDTIETLASSQFSGFKNLERIKLPKNLKSIERNTFNDCEKLNEINIPDSVTSIGEYAFDGCKSLKEIYIPKNVELLYGSTFCGCTSLDNIMVDPLNTHYKDIDGVLYNNDITKLYHYSKVNKEEFVLPDTVKEIDKYAVAGNDIKRVFIGENLEIIGKFAFEYVESLESFQVDEDNKYFASVEDVLYNKDKTQIIDYPKEKISKTYETLDTMSILDLDVLHDKNITKIILGQSINQIHRDLYNISTLENIEVHPDNKVYASVDGILYDKEVTSLLLYPLNKKDEVYNVPDSVEELYVFYNKTIKEINIGENLTYIDDRIFSRLQAIEEVNVSENNKVYCSNDGVVYSRDEQMLIWYPAYKPDKEFEVPSYIKTIGECAFSSNKLLENITLNYGLVEIERDAFEDCESLTNITLPETIEKLGNYIFSGTRNLKKVQMSNSKKFIESGCFHYSLIEEIEVVGALTQYELKKMLRTSFDENKVKFIAKEDVNGNRVFDLVDLALVAEHYNQSASSPDYDEKYNLDTREIIDIYDVVKIARLL